MNKKLVELVLSGLVLVSPVTALANHDSDDRGCEKRLVARTADKLQDSTRDFRRELNRSDVGDFDYVADRASDLLDSAADLEEAALDQNTCRRLADLFRDVERDFEDLEDELFRALRDLDRNDDWSDFGFSGGSRIVIVGGVRVGPESHPHHGGDNRDLRQVMEAYREVLRDYSDLSRVAR